MKYFILIFIAIVFSTCCKDNDAEFKKNCPYELVFGGHYLRIPITISPHQREYNIGDTLKISTVFSDSIYDLGTKEFFQIKEFPFKPTSGLYRIQEGVSHDSGYSVNELEISNVFDPVYFNSTNYVDGYRAYTIYEDGMYTFESQLVLKEAGTYIMLFSDLYQDNLGSGNQDLNAEADAITFEGKCPTLEYYLCSMIDSGDNHLDYYEDELVYLDEEVYRGKLGTITGSIGPLGSGGIRIELSGFFGFEVVE